MNEQSAVRGAVHRVNDLVVALPHLGLVRERLSALGYGLGRPPAVSEALGLALVELTGLGAAASTAADLGDSPLDVLIAGLRDHFSAGYDGWMPVLGKNREVETVGGTHVISGGGSELPVAAIGKAEAVAGGWDRRFLSDGAYVLPVPESDAGAAAGPLAVGAGLPRPDGDRGRGASVAVCDTGLWAHPSLAGAYLAAPEAMLPPEPGPAGLPFTAGHATFVTGTILRNAPGAAITVHATLDDHAKGTSWQLANDLVDLAGRGADVINISAGFFTGDDQPALAMTTALRLVGPRTVIVAAAGNHGGAEDKPRRPLWPAAHDEVVAVGALTALGTPAPFSTGGPWVQLLAPGVNVVSDYFDDAVTVTDPYSGETRRYRGVAAWSGTSFAAAWVSGLLAGRIRPGRVGARDALRQLIEDARAGTTAARLPDQCA
ncbi:hypothetical protein DMB66_02200 [Actinoplanes sp. ATCC 53533]|uniref:S8 family peptidase n=1 Tax=Actinoplanes sp. ATCC 53533 TaxID=1288362 RepID=UPI000F77D3CE|nr:S8/S53 family peptidase [Actinoplanes sp. ATCC 53533]RSM74240.1 hypothetical protein DMB66_02200 [Actinoplanes sp. ATCC 53533]